MLALISPTKKLDFSPSPMGLEYTQPAFMAEAMALMDVLGKLSARQLQKLMHLSDELAAVNTERVNSFAAKQTPKNAKQAGYTYSGETFIGLDAENFSKTDVAYAQDHLRIFSGLYGILRPLDLIQPYRLEMGLRLKNSAGADLYKFWGDKIAENIRKELAMEEEPVLVNLASNEFTKAANFKSLNARIVTPAFKEIKDGEAKTIGTFSKRARGMMARFMIINRIEEPEDLKKFAADGYKFKAGLSDIDNWVFTRKA